MTTVPRTTSVSFGIVTELTVDSEKVALILEKIQDRNVTVYRGGMVAGQRLFVMALLREMIPELEAPRSLQSLAIAKMAVELRPEKGVFAFEAAIENVWSVTLDSGPTLSIDSLSMSILSVKPPKGNNQANRRLADPSQQAAELSQQRKLTFEGVAQLFGGEVSVRAVHDFLALKPANSGSSVTASRLTFVAKADNISITEIVKAFGFDQAQLSRYGFESLVVSLAFTLEQIRYRPTPSQPLTKSSYRFRGEMDWNTGIELVPGEETLQIEAAVQIAKTSSNDPDEATSVLTGQISGTVSASVPFFDTLQLSVIYTFAKASRTAGAAAQALSTKTGELIFQLQVSTLLLNAAYTSVPDPQAPNDPSKNHKLLRFSVGLVGDRNPTVGDLIAYIVSLYDPSIVDFELDPPWDALAQQEIALDQFGLEVDLTEKSVTISYQATLDVLIAKVSNVGLSYQFGTDPAQAETRQARGASGKKVAIALNLSIPGQPAQRVQWDPVNENPPAVPGIKAPLFELQFLALGQRVAFAPEIVQQARTIKQFTDVMRQSLVPLPPIKRRQNPLTALQQSLPSAVSSDPTQPISFDGPPIRFSAESGWLIGAQFTIMGAIDLSVIFNDPFIYGVRISLSGPVVQIFAGLEFEILYRRISDTVGVYRAEITLPDAMRQLQFGAVAVTLPSVAVEIYTNGDFGIDVGFPWGGDFSRSIAVEVLIFLGVGGFYFNKLSVETATSVPVITNGTFDPVLEFGLGLKVGLGRTLRKGPLNAEVSITLHGLLQGVVAWFNPTDTRQEKAMYYRVQGGAMIVGRIYGSVDFKVIQVDVEVIAKVGVLFVVEVHKAIQVALVAEVSVRASVKVLFIRVHFSFRLTVREEFVLGANSTPPWQLAAASAGAMAVNVPVFSGHARRVNSKRVATPRRSAAAKGVALRAMGTAPSPFSMNVTEQMGGGVHRFGWDNGISGTQLAPPRLVRSATLKDDKLRLDLYFQPAFTQTEAGVSGIGLLFMENSVPVDESDQEDKDTDFDELVKALFKWVVYAYLPDSERPLTALNGAINVDEIELTQVLLEEIYTQFVTFLDEAPADTLWEPLIRFLSANFVFDICDRPLQNQDLSGTIFPMFPQLEMALKEDADTVLERIDFDAVQLASENIRDIQNHFRSQKYNHNQATEGSFQQPVGIASAALSRELAITELLFVDYFTLIMRSVLQLGIDHIRDEVTTRRVQSIRLVDLLDALNGEPYQSLAGMTSRFLLHGLRLPIFAGNTLTAGRQAAYRAIQQQFPVTVTPSAQAGEASTITPNEIRLSKPEAQLASLEWIRLIDAPAESRESETLTPDLNYAFPDSVLNNIRQLAQLSSASLPTAAPSLLPFYRSTPQQHTIRQRIYWQQDGGLDLLWELPLGMVNYFRSLAARSLRATFTLWPHSTAAGDPLRSQRPGDEITGYAWATKLSLTVRRVSRSETNEFLPSVYALEPPDIASLELLQAILSAPVEPTLLALLYFNDGTEPKALMRHAEADILLLKRDLSIGDNSQCIVKLSDRNSFIPFLRLVQESSLAGSSGYYLSYVHRGGGLPDDLFTDGETAKLTLLITFAASQPESYNNCLHMPFGSAGIEKSRQALSIFSESSEQVHMLGIPAGNLGFRLRREEPPSDSPAAVDQLQTLYQLLHYAIPEHVSDFSSAHDWLPVGPVEEADSQQDWLYEKVLPVYALSTAAIETTALPVILKETLDPYRGIGRDFQLNFQWQDIYGNRLGDRGKLQSLLHSVGYFDPILGLNQWPAVGESYRITRHSSRDRIIALVLELAFDQAKYIPTPTNPLAEALDHIKTDRATYQKIYYQVHDPNLMFKATTSVIPQWSQGLGRTFFTDFVDSVYRYLVTLEHLVAVDHLVSANGESLASIADSYRVSLEDLAEINRELAHVFVPQAIQVPVGIRVLTTDTLQGLATELTQPNSDAARLNNKIAQIIASYKTTAGLFVDSEPIRQVLGYTIRPVDTLESVAIAQLAIAEDRRIEAALIPLAESLDTIQALADGVLIKVGPSPEDDSRYVVLNASLETVAYRILQLESADPLDPSFEDLLAQRIDAIRSENASVLRELAAGAPIPANTVLTIEQSDRTTPIAFFPVTIRTLSNKTWTAIASAFPTPALDDAKRAVILANAARQDLLVEGATLNNKPIQPHESLWHIAVAEVMGQAVSPSVLRTPTARSEMVAEVGALNYPLVAATPPTLVGLTHQLHLQTNRHRTVLETVRAVGNISMLLTEAAITAQLVRTTNVIRDLPGLFGDTDIILSDVLLDYRIAPEDSFDAIIVKAASQVNILTEQTTAAGIAAYNPNLSLRSGSRIDIPGHFTLAIPPNASAAVRDQLATKVAPAQSTLASLAALMSDTAEVTPAAVVIANQTLAGRLTAHTPLNLSPLIASFLSMAPAEISLFLGDSTLSIRPEETLYTLTARLEGETLKAFHSQLTMESSLALQAIGTVNALYEQLTFKGANRTALRNSLITVTASLKTTLFTPESLAAVGTNVLKPPFTPFAAHTQLADLEVAAAIASLETALAIEDNLALTTTLNDTLTLLNRMYDLSILKTALGGLEQRFSVGDTTPPQRPLTVAEVGSAIARIPNLVVSNSVWIIPPFIANTALTLDIGEPENPAYPTDLMFPVTVQVEMRRPPELIHRDDTVTLPEIESITGDFLPKTIAIAPSPASLSSLTPFATDFEAALPNLKLAVGKKAPDATNPQSSDTLWAVHLGSTGIHYDIQAAAPIFFSTAPLSNALMSGTVSLPRYSEESGLSQTSAESMRVEAVDLNGLARIYLRAIEEILKPETSSPAANNTAASVEIERILNVKARLADAISKNVTHVLEPEAADRAPESEEYQRRRVIAMATLKKELLKNLADAYDLETIVQYTVAVETQNSHTWPTQPTPNLPPRLSGQPTITGAHYTGIGLSNSEADDTLLQSLDFTLSPATIALETPSQPDSQARSSILSFFFNTQTPQRYEDIALDLTYQVNELEYNIDPSQLTSSWLSFVLPLNPPGFAMNPRDPNHMGTVQIPIPLRDYPIPPSLIGHRAVPDPDGFAGNILSSEDIRDWNYVFLYEHPDVAQDTIECRIDYNTSTLDQSPTLTIDSVIIGESSGTALFTVTLFPPAEETVTVEFATVDGSAIAPEDYTFTNGQLRFAPGNTTQTISVPIVSDAIVENNEAFTVALSNATNATIATASGTGTIIDAPLLDTLVQFNHLYPTLKAALTPLAEEGITEQNQDGIVTALGTFATLSENVAIAWQNWQPAALTAARTIHYTLDEDLLENDRKQVIIAPTQSLPEQAQQILQVELPGYTFTQQNGQAPPFPPLTKPYRAIEYTFEKLPNATGQETFGDSALPDRKITVIDLDVLHTQNAWSAIRLARNKNLVDGRTTNPAFIFQTPEVRFKSRITPLIINDKRWNIGALSPSPQPLSAHLQTLFETLLPAQESRAYDLRLSCQYAFAITLGNPGAADDLLTSLPVLLTPRFTVRQSAAKPTMLAVTEQLRANIVTEIEDWQTQKRPNRANGRYIFSISLFSHHQPSSRTADSPNLPLLKIEHLWLALADIQ